jgi:glycosyltransferase involved in cell wall biosynthesis
MRVLLVAAATATDGGGEKHVADLVERLPGRGVEVALAAPPGGDLAQVAAASSVPAFAASIGAGLSAAGIRALRRTILRLDPDVVHAHGARAAAFVRVADPAPSRRVVYTLHGIHVDQAGGAGRRSGFLAVERTLRARTARFVCVCRADAAKGASLRILDVRRTAVVHNGIDAPLPSPAGLFRAELGLGPDVPLVLSVGRLHEQKDQATLLSGFRELLRFHPEAVLALVGSGPLEAELAGVIRDEDLAGRARLLAPRADLGPAYADADVFTLSSRWEGLPYVVLEAMAHGLPVVATAVDGVPEAVCDGRTGLLVPPGDPGALAAALGSLLGSKDARRRMGAAGRRRVETRFTLEQMLAGVTRVYAEVTALAPAASSSAAPSNDPEGSHR